jgi:hypothetical protein
MLGATFGTQEYIETPSPQPFLPVRETLLYLNVINDLSACDL